MHTGQEPLSPLTEQTVLTHCCVLLAAAVTSEWLEFGGMVVELLLQPFAATRASGEHSVGLIFSALDGRQGGNLPATVRFQARSAAP